MSRTFRNAPLPNILICIKEKPVEERFTAALRQIGYEVPDSVSSVEDALRCAETTEPDLILMDVGLLGDVDGDGAAPSMAGIAAPIVYLVDSVEQENLQGAMVREPYGRLSKHADTTEIRIAVEIALHKRRADKRSRESEERFRAFFENAGILIGVADREGRWLYMNGAFRKWLGYEQDELARLTLLDITHPEDAGAAARMIEDLAEHRIPGYRGDRRCVGKDGATVWADISFSPILDEQGRTESLMAAGHDITERKFLEDAHLFLAKAGSAPHEDFFKALAQYLAVTLGMDFVCIDRLKGDGLWAETVAVYSDGEFQDNIEYALKDMPCGEVAGKVICCFPRDVRRLFPLDPLLQEMPAESYAGVTLWGSSGRPIGLIAIIGRRPRHDLKPAEAVLKLVAVRAAGELERRAREEALRVSEARYRTLVEHLPHKIFLKDLNSVYVSCNEHYAHGLGITAVDIAGKTDLELYPQALARKYREDDRRVMESGEVEEFEEDYCGRGEVRRVLTVKAPVRDNQGLIAGVLGIFSDITDRKMAQAKLIESEERLRLALKAAKAGAWEWDLRTNENFWSGELWPLYGLEPHSRQPSYDAWLSTVHPDDRAEVERLVQGAVLQGAEIKAEWRTNGTCADPRWLMSRGQPVYDDAGRLIRYIGIVIDITDRKTAEAAARERELRFRAYFDLPLIGIAVTSPEKGWLEVNDRLCDMLGYTREELTRKTWAELTHPDDLAKDEADFNRVLAGEIDGYSMEKRFFRNSAPNTGETLRTDLAVRCVRKIDGSVDYFVVLIQDISRRKKDEEEITKQKEFMDLTINSLAFPFYVINAEDFTIEMANTVAVSSGIAPDSKCYEATHGRNTPCDGSEHPCPLEEVKKSRCPVAAEHTHYDGMGRKRSFAINCFPIPDGGGAVKRAIEFTIDITDNKSAQEAIIQNAKMRAVLDLTAGVAHNFNNLLQIVLGNASLGLLNLQSGDFTDLKANLDQVIESSMFGAETVRRLNKYARNRPQIQSPDREVFDLSELVGQAVEMSRPWWKAGPEKDGVMVSLNARLSPQCVVRGDKSELFEVTINLIKNAVEALPNGGGIELDTFVEGHTVVLRVRDTGIGIKSDHLDRLFTPFFTTNLEAGKRARPSHLQEDHRRPRRNHSCEKPQGRGFGVPSHLAFRPRQPRGTGRWSRRRSAKGVNHSCRGR